MLPLRGRKIILRRDADRPASGVLGQTLVSIIPGEDFVVLKFQSFDAIAIAADAPEYVAGDQTIG